MRMSNRSSKQQNICCVAGCSDCLQAHKATQTTACFSFSRSLHPVVRQSDLLTFSHSRRLYTNSSTNHLLRVFNFFCLTLFFFFFFPQLSHMVLPLTKSLSSFSRSSITEQAGGRSVQWEPVGGCCVSLPAVFEGGVDEVSKAPLCHVPDTSELGCRNSAFYKKPAKTEFV